MKKLIFVTVVLFAFLSCSKDRLTNSSPENEGVNQNSNNQALFKSALTIFYDNGGDDYGCKGVPGNCSGIVPVYPKGIINNIFNIVNGQDGVAIVNVFTNQYNVLKGLMDSRILDNVLNGTYTVTARGTKYNSVRHLIFSTQGANSQLVEAAVVPFANNTYKAAAGKCFYDNGGNDYGCKTGQCYCADIIVVYPAGVMNNVFGVVNSQNQTAIKNVFTNHAKKLKQVLQPKIVNQVISGKLTVESKGKKKKNTTRYLLFYRKGPNGTKVLGPVIPFNN